ncbi:DUF3310 domain-containing protein [Staphylococcus cohnii]
MQNCLKYFSRYKRKGSLQNTKKVNFYIITIKIDVYD